ncbi:MAG: hypothetical protein ACJ71Z_05990 [Aeromicrobium sp.]
MTSVLVGGIALLVVVAAAFMILWVVDARRADRVAADPERVQGHPPRRRWWAHSRQR